jgi:MFS superfamily sulfate permease-like transporter
MSVTFAVTALVDVAKGLEVGFLLSVVVLLFRLSAVERRAMGKLDDEQQSFVPLDRYPQAKERPGIKCYKLTGYLWFGNATKLRDQVNALMDHETHEGHPLTHVVLDFSGGSGLDLTTVRSLQYLVSEAERLGVRLVLAECSDGVRRNLRQAGMLQDVGGEMTRRCLEEVVALLEHEKRAQSPVPSAAAGAAAVNKGDVEAASAGPAPTGAGDGGEEGAGDSPVSIVKTAAAVPFYRRVMSRGGGK